MTHEFSELSKDELKAIAEDPDRPQAVRAYALVLLGKKRRQAAEESSSSPEQ